jgi:hypothetical protein
MEPLSDLTLIEKNDQSGNSPYTIYIKDKYGAYFVQPFIDKSKKLVSIETCTSITSSKTYTAVFIS